MSKTNVLVYYDLNGGDDETVQTVKEKAAFLRGRVGGRSVNLRDAKIFDEVEPRVAIAILLGGTSSTALASVYEAYEAVGVPLSSYDEFVGGGGADLIEEDEEPESAGSYLGRLKAAATDRGLTFTDATTADELEAMIKSHDDAKHQKVIDDMAAAEAREDEEAPAFGVETADFDALKAKADALEIAYPSNIGEATLRKKVADHLKGE